MQVFREEPGLFVREEKWALGLNKKKKGTVSKFHWHDSYEILYVRRGTAVQRINADTFEVNEGDWVLICPEDMHDTGAVTAEGCDIDVLQFYPDIINCSDDGNKLYSCVIHPDQDAVGVIDAMWKIKEEDTEGKNLIATGLIQILCGFLLPYCKNNEIGARSESIREVCEYLKKARDIRLLSIAQKFNYSPEHLSRTFHKEMGITYYSYCNIVRMRRAIALLSNREMGIGEIAEILGYSDSASFIRAFKRTYNTTPTGYRKREDS